VKLNKPQLGKRMNNVKHICLDKDGTIIDVHLYWTHIIRKRTMKIIELYDMAVEHLSDLTLAMGIDLNQQRIIPAGPVGYKPRDVVIEAAAKALEQRGVSVTHEQISEIFLSVDRQMQANEDYNIKVLDNVHDALKRMKAFNFKVSIFSSDTSKNLKKNIKTLNMDAQIDAIVGGDEVNNSKPDPEGFQLACERVGIPLAHSIYVGDTLDDMIMAKRCNSLGGYGITTGLCSKEQLIPQARYVFDFLAELVEFLAKERENVQRCR
jgi:phosphoglycolate phosphatase